MRKITALFILFFTVFYFFLLYHALFLTGIFQQRTEIPGHIFLRHHIKLKNTKKIFPIQNPSLRLLCVKTKQKADKSLSVTILGL